MIECDTKDLPAPCSHVEHLALVSPSSDPWAEPDTTDELFISSGIYLLWYRLVRSQTGVKLKCQALKHMKHNIRNVALAPGKDRIMVTDT
jgi:hypothetical protein